MSKRKVQPQMHQRVREVDRRYPDSMAERRITIPLGQRLRDAPRQTTSMSLPLPVHYRLDELVHLAGDVNSNRAELIAMLIASAPLDSRVLEDHILAYRKSTVGEVIPDALIPAAEGGSVVVPLHGPGRRRKQDAGG